MSSAEDLTTRARIRDAALTRFGHDGIRATTLRAIAKDAGVSAPLIVHHFGSKQGLLSACVDHAHAITVSVKRSAVSTMPVEEQAHLMANSEEFHPLLRFLIRLLGEEPELSRKLWETMLGEVTEWLALGEQSGMIRPTDDPQGRALVMMSASVGQLMLSDLIAAKLGGDQADAISRLGLPTLELFTHGVLANSDLLDRSRELLRTNDQEV